MFSVVIAVTMIMMTGYVHDYHRYSTRACYWELFSMTGIFHILDVEGAVAWNPVKQHEGK